MNADARETLTVALGSRSYDVVVGPGLLAEAPDRLLPLLARRTAAVVTDSHVADLYLAPLSEALRAASIEIIEHVVPAGDSSKCWSEAERLCETLLEARLARDDMVIALGGGMIGDLAGFAAAITRRGMPFVQIPTTLLAQVDSAVGGKTAINTAEGKNLVGCFHQPSLVLADTQTLSSLPRREMAAGYAEIVKYGALGDAAFFDWLCANGAGVLKGETAPVVHAVRSSVEAKARIVAEDERESGVRALLNFGHSFAHAIEAAAGYSGAVLHGEAVAVGMVMAATLSAELGHASTADRDRLAACLRDAGLPTTIGALAVEIDPGRLEAALAQDKKNRAGRAVFILWRGIGEAFISDRVPMQAVKGLIADAAGAA